MPRGVYTVEFNNITANNADGDFDFFEIDPATEKPVELVSISIGQASEIGDAQEEFIRWAVLRFSGGTFTSGGEVSTTPRLTDPFDQAASFAAEAMNSNGTAASSSGTTVRLWSGTFNIRAGLDWIWVPEDRPKCDGTAQSAMVVRCESTVTDDITFSGKLTVKEL